MYAVLLVPMQLVEDTVMPQNKTFAKKAASALGINVVVMTIVLLAVKVAQTANSVVS